MKKIQLIYNPFSGDRRFKDALDSCAEIFFDAGYLTSITRITTEDGINAVIKDVKNDDRIVAAGGDGTINMVINAMKRHEKESPLGIIPAGTANDFASFLDMPKDPRGCAETIANGRIISADLGCANGQYFNNVCGGGLFINISHSMSNDTVFKSIFGKLAYYIKGLGQLPNITPLKLRITTPSATIEDEFALFLLLNSGGCGGFHKISPNASITDGLLDFVAFRYMPMKDIAGLFPKILAGGHLEDHRILFSHESSIKVEHLGTDKIDTDVDGEPGPKMPLSITCEKGALSLIVPNNFK
ncbi:MAG: YegS/Rv2252/BmrU family lipid kinase [Clostridiales bacterium]|jgi:YegS/Rv2252/BmrU family lipid kinase|nr:YegS/Rv2252/BmrU family lipid kinase [Clostridiales bacterium]